MNIKIYKYIYSKMTTDIVQLKNMITDLKKGVRDRIITDKVSTIPESRKKMGKYWLQTQHKVSNELPEEYRLQNTTMT